MAAIVGELPRPGPLFDDFAVGKRAVGREDASDTAFVVEVDPDISETRTRTGCGAGQPDQRQLGQQGRDPSFSR